MIIGYFDYVVLAVLIFLNFKYWNNKTDLSIGCLTATLFTTLCILSIFIELKITMPGADEIDDSFNHVYVILKVPLYFFAFVVQGLILLFKKRVQNFYIKSTKNKLEQKD